MAVYLTGRGGTVSQSGKRHSVVSLLPLNVFADFGHFSDYLPLCVPGYTKEAHNPELSYPVSVVFLIDSQSRPGR